MSRSRSIINDQTLSTLFSGWLDRHLITDTNGDLSKFLFMFLFASFCSALLTCKNVAGGSVDSWAAFKVPNSVSGVSGGVAYFYRDDSTPLARAAGAVNLTTNNPIYHSLAPLWGKDANVGYALLNDQPPDVDDVSSTYAHLKGVIIFDKDSGIYLVHSVPHFPPNPGASAFSYPSSGTVYGQAFECFTLNHNQLELIAQDLLVERPYVYAMKFPTYTDSLLPSLKKVLNGQYNKTTIPKVTTVVTRGGIKVTHLAKAREWGSELYHDLVAPTYKAKVYSETWALGSGTLASDCSGSWEAHNILTVKFGTLTWKRTQDHSKWAVVGQTVCIGDINRQSGQLNRGGGTFCRTDSKFFAEVNAVLGDIEQC
jgi:deoxyribonuclease-2